MDCDGTKAGYDLELTRRISEAVPVPVIASGGAGTMEHFYDALTEGRADAALAASLFHFKELEIREVKEALRRCFARFSLSARMDPTPFSLMIRPVGAYAEIRLEIKPPLVARQISQLREHILRFLRGRENATLTFLAWPSETSSREMSLPVRIGRDGEDVLCDFLASLSSLPYPTERVSVLPLSVDRLARLTVYG